MLTDIEISRQANIRHIGEIAEKLGLDRENDVEYYGRYKAKLSEGCYDKLISDKKRGKLILVTAMNPTPFGEGKTTMSIGLGQALAKLGKKTVIALREPSLGPVFGIKGGAAGGGYSQVIPMEDINLHFTGDFHAITTANNLLCAAIDNHIHHGNELGIDPDKIVFSRCMDMNDRALREVLVGLGGKINGVPRKDGFRITAASEIMAIFCLAETFAELRTMLGNITVGYTFDARPVRACELKVQGSMSVLLKEAFMPNLVQTVEGVPVFIHGGPFANIAQGTNSLRATKAALALSDYTVTEAGFGADLGAEKFIDIKCRKGGLSPDAVVIVSTIRSMKHNAGIQKENLSSLDIEAVKTGFENVRAHFANIKKFDLDAVCVLNRFPDDFEEEIELVRELCGNAGIPFTVSTAFSDGGSGSLELAEIITDICEKPKQNGLKFVYELSDGIKTKIDKIAKNIYGAKGVTYLEPAETAIRAIESLGDDYANLAVCMAKTQYSFSDNPKLLCRPTDFEITVRNLIAQTGAGFIVVLTGDIMIMPGLPKVPAANAIDIDGEGFIVNLS